MRWAVNGIISYGNRYLLIKFFLISVLCLPATDILAQNAEVTNTSTGSLVELSELRDMFLVVTKNPTVATTNQDKSIIRRAYDKQSPLPRIYPFKLLASKLNKYIRKYRSMSAVPAIESADYIIAFNVLEYSRSITGSYAYGEMFVTINPKSLKDDTPLRIVWRTSKPTHAEAAVNQFLKDLKKTRQEK